MPRVGFEPTYRHSPLRLFVTAGLIYSQVPLPWLYLSLQSTIVERDCQVKSEKSAVDPRITDRYVQRVLTVLFHGGCAA